MEEIEQDKQAQVAEADARAEHAEDLTRESDDRIAYLTTSCDDFKVLSSTFAPCKFILLSSIL